jgi:hypothetical protein
LLAVSWPARWREKIARVLLACIVGWFVASPVRQFLTGTTPSPSQPALVQAQAPDVPNPAPEMDLVTLAAVAGEGEGCYAAFVGYKFQLDPVHPENNPAYRYGWEKLVRDSHMYLNQCKLDQVAVSTRRGQLLAVIGIKTENGKLTALDPSGEKDLAKIREILAKN